MEDRAAVEGEALVVECRLVIMLLLTAFFESSAKYVIEILHVPTMFVAQRLLYNHYDPVETLF
jgi:hypothetical protein